MSKPCYMGLAKKFIVVTGSTGGIGLAIATGLARHDARVVLNGRTMESCEKAKQKILKEVSCDAANLLCIPGDVSDTAGATAFIAAIKSHSTPVDVLINNVGMFGVRDFFEVTDAEWLEYFNKNVMSGVLLAQAFLKPMIERNSGRVIFISSECGMRPIPHMIPYSMTKACQISLARGLAELTKGTTVTVNSVLPGPTMTEGVQKYMEDFASHEGLPSMEVAVKEYFKRNETTSLLQRFLDPVEVANCVCFLASDQSSCINGSALLAEGGIVRHI